jgi:single-strand DNA-binding protein
MQMLGGRGGSGGGAGGGASFDDGGYGDSSPAPMQSARPAPQQQRSAPAASKPAPQKPASFDDFEDDIPF